MLISYRRQFIFVHVPKVAGSSIHRALQRFAYRPEIYLGRALLQALPIASVLPRRLARSNHLSAAEIRQRLPEVDYDRFFKFAFVRNPWDHVVSMYHYILQSKRHRHHHSVSALGDFSTYVKWLSSYPHFVFNGAFQKWFVTDGDEVLVDFVGRFESLQNDFQYVCRKLGVHTTLPHANTSRHEDYRTYYQQETADAVRRLFSTDIEFFGYEFDGGTSTRTVPSTGVTDATSESIPELGVREAAS